MLKRAASILFTLVMLCFGTIHGQNGYQLRVLSSHAADMNLVDKQKFPASFERLDSLQSYVSEIPSRLRNQGYLAASIDSMVLQDTLMQIQLYIGELHRWGRINVSAEDEVELNKLGYPATIFQKKILNMDKLNSWQNQIISYLSTRGYPFASVYLDSFQLQNPQEVEATLKIDRGVVATFDSIRLLGKPIISRHFLYRYFNVKPGTPYDQNKIDQIAERLKQLNYLDEEYPTKQTWVGSKTYIDMYLKKKANNQVNAIIGFLPNAEGNGKKLLVTGEANLLLQNELGQGERIQFNWQQLQKASPRLYLSYMHPYIFNSPTGIDVQFELYKKDSAFVNINFQLGARYSLEAKKTVGFYFRSRQSNLGTIDENAIISTYKLPSDADISLNTLGIDYSYTGTNNLRNPTEGWEYLVTANGGIRKIKKSTSITSIKDPNNPAFNFASLYDTVSLRTYQLFYKGNIAKYIPIAGGRRTTLKLAANTAYIFGKNLYRNEQFQIGGFKLLRGFDEESQFVNAYGIATAEFRYLVGAQSYFYAFADGGWAQNKVKNNAINYNYISGGLGMVFESKLGIINFAWALGRRNDIPFNLRQSKIHFGYLSYF